MQIPQIRMESQYAKIRIEQRPAALEIEQPKAELTIEQPKAELTIRTTPGKLTIDQMQAWEEMNLMNTNRLTEKRVEEAKQLALEGTARRAQQGAELLDIHLSKEIIADQARQNQLPQLKQLSIKYIPSPLAVKTTYERGELHIEVEEKRPVIDVVVRKPEITYHPGEVMITMEQYPELRIDFEPLYV